MSLSCRLNLFRATAVLPKRATTTPRRGCFSPFGSHDMMSAFVRWRRPLLTTFWMSEAKARRRLLGKPSEVKRARAYWARTLRASCGPFCDAGSTLLAPIAFSCERGTHACFCGGCCAAYKSVSCYSLTCGRVS